MDSVINRKEVGEFALGVLLLAWDWGSRGPPMGEWGRGWARRKNSARWTERTPQLPLHPQHPLLWNQILSLRGRRLSRKSHEGRTAGHTAGSGRECPGLLVLSEKSRSPLVGPRCSDDDCADLHRDKRRLLSTESPFSHTYLLYLSLLDAFTFLSHHMLQLARDNFWKSYTTVEGLFLLHGKAS